MGPQTRGPPMRALSCGSPAQLIACCESDCSGPDRDVETKGKAMMKITTKVIVTGAATMLGVAMVAGGAYAATGSMTAADAPGQVAQVSSVGPAAAHASPTALAHADANAKGLFGATAARTPAVAPKPVAAHATAHVTMHATFHQVARPAAQQVPAHHASTSTCGTAQGHTGMHGSTGTSGSAGMMR